MTLLPLSCRSVSFSTVKQLLYSRIPNNFRGNQRLNLKHFQTTCTIQRNQRAPLTIQRPPYISNLHSQSSLHNVSFLSSTYSICDSCYLRYSSASAGDQKSASKKVQEEVEEEVEEEEDDEVIPTKDEHGKPLTNWQRMKIMAKTYGYVIIPVHWVIAPVWFGSFYYAIKMGVDIEPMLHKIGVSDHHVETLKNSRASTALMAYALYKIFTPFRYTLTLGATEFTIRFLRKRGFIKPIPKKQKTYRQSIKDTYSEVKDKLKKEEVS